MSSLNKDIITIIMSGEGDIVFGMDPVGVGVGIGVTLFCLHDIS